MAKLLTGLLLGNLCPLINFELFIVKLLVSFLMDYIMKNKNKINKIFLTKILTWQIELAEMHFLLPPL